jgi:hypothetical protein
MISLWSVKSPNNSLKAVVTSWKDSNEDNQFIEVNILYSYV